MTQPARLIARYGPQPQREYALAMGATTIGRDAINDIALDDTEISRRHARILFSGGRYILEDLGSTNGTFVNGVEIQTPTALADGVAVDFGSTQRFTFQGPSGLAASFAEPTLLDGIGGLPAEAPPADEPTMRDPQPGGLAAPAFAAPDVPTVQDAPALRREQPPTIIQGPVAPAPAAPAAARPPSPRRTRLILFGCLFSLVLIGLVVVITLFALDALAPDLLYCGALRPLAEFIAGFSGQALVCP